MVVTQNVRLKVYIDGLIYGGGVILTGNLAAAAVTSTGPHFRTINVSGEEHLLLERPHF